MSFVALASTKPMVGFVLAWRPPFLTQSLNYKLMVECIMDFERHGHLPDREGLLKD